jgi:phage/plasmid-associated DNA primase
MNVTEKVDLRKIQYLKSLDFKSYKLLTESKKADKDQKVLFDNLQRYCNEMIKGKGEFIRTYHHTLSTPLEAGGRLFCAGAIQGFPKNIRGYLFGDTTTDIDMKNAHPTILRFICRDNKILSPQLASYIENRDDVLNMVSDRDELKEIFLKSFNDDKPIKKSVLNKYSKELQKIIKDFDDEMKTIQSKVISLPHYKSCVDTVPSNRLYNFNGSAINRILCYEEDKILKIMVNYLASKQIQISALMFDGCMPYGNFYDNEELIDELEDEVNSSERYRNKLFLLLSYKGHSTTIVTPEDFVPQEDKLKGLTICGNELEASNIIFEKLSKRLINCNKTIWFRFNDYVWNDNLKSIESYIRNFTVNSEIYRLDKDENPVDFVQNFKTASNITKLVLDKMVTKNVYDDWFKKNSNTSRHKLLFNNGFVDMKTGMFHKLDELDDKIYFFEKISHDYTPSLPDDIASIKKRFFTEPLGLDVGEYFAYTIAQGLAGDALKRFVICVGTGNGGKSTLTQAIQNSCGGYFGTFNAGNLAFKKDSGADEASQLRWLLLLATKRITISNEIKEGSTLAGGSIKKMSSGGKDYIVGRLHGGYETESPFIALPIVNLNDACGISPVDEAINNRVKSITYSKAYVPVVENPDYELLADLNIDTEVFTYKFKIDFINYLIQCYTKLTKKPELEVEPEAVRLSKEQWFGVCKDNIMNKFLDRYEVSGDKEHFVSNDDLKSWIDSSKMNVSNNKLSVEIKKYVEIKKLSNVICSVKKIGGKPIRGWFGITELSEEN